MGEDDFLECCTVVYPRPVYCTIDVQYYINPSYIVIFIEPRKQFLFNLTYYYRRIIKAGAT